MFVLGLLDINQYTDIVYEFRKSIYVNVARNGNANINEAFAIWQMASTKVFAIESYHLIPNQGLVMM